MARPQNRKRQRGDDPSQDHPPTKKVKSKGGHHNSNFPPKFWDNLSKVWLTRRALRELDRRNTIRPLPEPSIAVGDYSADIARFARHGGPDLHHLRGYPEPKGTAQVMASGRSSASAQSRRTRDTQSTNATSLSSKARRSSAYDDDFEQHLVDNSIYPEGHAYGDDRSTPEPANINEIKQRMAVSRASLSPSHFSESQFREFKRKNARLVSEGKVMSGILPTICGEADIEHEENLRFTNLASITEDATVDAQPDFFDGARPEDIDRDVRQSLSKTIIPTKHPKAPVAPNCFLEAKAPKGGADVAKRQITHDLAIGARSIFGLQNYGEDEPIYDGNVYTYRATYHDGQLKLYGTHVTAPTVPGERPEYHTTQLRTFGMTDTRDTFAEGAGAFRNLRENAKGHRDRFIGEANTRARRSQKERRSDPKGKQPSGAELEQDEDYEDYLASQDTQGERPFPPYAPQQDFNDTDGYATYADVNEGPSLPQYVFPEDDQQDESQEPFESAAEPPDSFATSFTSSLTSGVSRGHESRSKRPRASQSPPSTSHHPKHGSAKGHYATRPAHPSGSKHDRHKKSKSAGAKKVKGKASVSNTGDDDDWEWDDEAQEYKTWNDKSGTWEFWDEEYQARKYWDGEEWQWVT